MLMVIVGLVAWWYGVGWRLRVRLMREHIAQLYDFFSIDLLVRTLFSPFRQISAGSVQGALTVQLRAWMDRLISRAIGSFVRTIVIVVGAASLMIAVAIHTILVILWAFVPLMPIGGVILAIAGWIPWSI